MKNPKIKLLKIIQNKEIPLPNNLNIDPYFSVLKNLKILV